MHSIQSSTVIPFPYHNQMEWSMPLNLVEYTGFDHLHHIFRYIFYRIKLPKSHLPTIFNRKAIDIFGSVFT